MKEKLFNSALSKFFLAAVLCFASFAKVSSQNDVKITAVDTATDMVTLTNIGASSIDASGYWLCLGPGTYQNVGAINGGAATIPSGGTLALPYNVDPVADGLSLFSTNTFGSSDPSILLDFVQWGAANQPRSGQAVTAGRWDDASQFINCPAPYSTTTGGNVAAWIESIVNAGEITLDNGETSTSICVDGVGDPLNVNVGAGSIGSNPGWIITDASTNQILALPAGPPFDLDGAGVGTCEIWYIRYEAGLSGNMVGNNLSDLEGCFDLSEPIEVIREEADGGTVEIDIAATGNPNNTTTISADGLSAVICVDGQADPLVVIHENPGAENLSYRYVITANDTDQTILAIAGSNEISLDGAGAGTCLIWGWSYRGVPDNGAGFIGGPLADLDAENCSDISDNSIEVIREEADGGTVEIDIAATGNPNNTTTISADGLSAVICVDGQADPLVVIHENPGAENLSYRYVITANDTDQTILAISGSNEISLDGAGAGTCLIWGWSYRGVPDNGAGFIGSPLADLNAEDCSDISDNSIEVIREEADGGTVEIDIAATGNPNNTTTISADGLSAVICVDGQADPLVVIHENPGAENLSYRYVITANDTDQTILAISGSNEISLDGAGVGTCLIWGWSYRGVPDNGAGFIGSPLADLNAEDCSDISDNSIEVVREEANGGTVSLANGDTEVSICAGDGTPDPLEVIHENPGSENLSYRYVITDSDADNTILGISGSSTIDLEGAGEGVCRIWGWSYRGVADNGAGFIGSPLADLQAESCSDISDDFVQVTRLTGDDCEVLSVETVDLGQAFSMFPNPTNGVVEIQLTGVDGSFTVAVYDLNGRIVESSEITVQSTNTINLTDLSSGVYLVRLTNNETGNTTVKRLVRS